MMLARLLRSVSQPRAAARSRRPVVEELEPRILYSADLAPVVDTETYAPEMEVRTLDGAGEFDATQVETAQGPDTDSAVAGAAAAPDAGQADSQQATPAASADVDTAAQPLVFERNVGQTDAQVDFLARGSGYGVWLADGDAWLALDGADGGHVVRLDVLGTNPDPLATGEDELGAYTNYLVGDQSSWRTGVESYGAVRYDDVYAGIDLRYYGNGHQLEYDFIVDAGADAGAIRMAFDGTQALSIDAQGNLVLVLDEAGRTLTFEAPITYQEGALGREAVFSRYVLLDDGSVGFEVGPYDATRELVIDPILAYGTYLGGSGGEQIWNMDTDAAGNVYVTGYTNSTDFPMEGAFSGPRGNQDVFVSKFSPDLGTLVYSTYVGGSSGESGYGIAVDAAGNAYVTGATASADFALAAAYDSSLDNGQDAFVFKLNASGTAMVYSTFLGGAGSLDTGYGIAVDGAGNAYIAGYTDSSSGFPLVSALDSSFSNGEAFVTKLNAAGSAVVYSTYFGGDADETIYNIAVDAAGNAVVVGESNSTTFSVALPGAYQAGNDSNGSKYDAFVAKLNASGTGLLYGSFLGGGQDDFGYGVALDAAGKIYIAGDAQSGDFDVTAGAMQTSEAGGLDGFIAIFDPTVSGAGSLLYSTYVGGSLTESLWGVDVDAAGRVYAGGHTTSTNFPVTGDAYQSVNAGGEDIFVLVLEPNGAGVADRVYASYLGGGNAEDTWAARYANGKFYVAGNAASDSASGITTPGAYDTGFNGGFDGYIAAFSFESPPVLGVAGTTLAYAEGSGAVAVDSSLTLSDADNATLVGATVTISANYNSAEDELAFNNANPWGITGIWSAATGTLTLSGPSSVANYQLALRSVTYQNTSERPSTLTRGVAFTADDGALTSAVATRQIAVSSLNDPPSNTAPFSQAASEDAPLVFSVGNGNAISVADVDAGGASLQVTLTAGSGRLTLAQTTGLAFTTGDGTSDTGMTFTGTAANINAALNGLRFDPNADFSGSASVQIVTNDLGNSGSGGPLSDSDTVVIGVSAVNDAPVQSVPGGQVTPQNTPLVFSAGSGNAITIADVDVGGGELSVTLTAVNGVLTLGSLAGLSSVLGDGTDSIAITGTLADLNNALDGLQFTPDVGYSGPASVTVATDDLGNFGAGGAGTDSDVIAVTVSPNVAPLVTTSVSALTYFEDAGAVPLDTALTVSDLDSPVLSEARLRILGGYVPGEEKLQFLDQLGIAGVWDEPTGTLTLTGAASAADYQTALRAVTYLNTSANPSGTRSVAIVVNDGVADGAAADRTILLEAQNDAPTIGVPGPQSVREDTPLVFSLGNGNQIVIADQDAGSSVVRLTLTASHGTLTLLQTTGLSFFAGGNGSGSMSVDGSIDDLNAALSALQFDVDADYVGAALLQVELDDLGNHGSPGALTALRSVDIDVTAVNDGPVGADRIVSTPEDTAYVFSTADFALADPHDWPADALLAVRIVSLPGGGELTNDGIPVASGSFVSAADIGAGKLLFTPFPQANGLSYATLGFQVQDDGGTADGGIDLDQTVRTLTIDVTAVNDDPMLDVPGLQTTPADTALVLSNANGNALTVADIDENGGGLGVSLTVADGTLTLATTAGLSGLAGNGTGSVSFTASPDAINDALDGLIFTPSAAFFGGTALDILVDDLGNTGAPGPLQALASVIIDVTSVATSLAATPGADTYTEDTPAVVIDAGLTLSGGTLTEASVQIVANYVDGEDLLSYDGGLVPGGVSVSWVAASGLLIFTGSASAAQYEALLRSVTFEALGDAPSTATRTIEFAVDDGVSVVTATRDMDVVAENDAPTAIGVSNASVAENTDTSAGYVIGSLSTTDPDVVDAFTYSVTGGADQLRFSVAGDQLVLTDGSLDFEAQSSYTVEVTSTDSGLLSTSQIFVISVADVNEAPTISAISNQSIAEDTGTGVISFTIGDPETNPDSLVVTAFSSNPTLVPVGNIVLGGSGANRTVTVTPAANAYGGPVNITIRVSDGTNNPQRVFAVAITGTADTPSVTNAATPEDTQSASGLVITRNGADGPEVTHFKITGISGGTLYLSDGVTPVVNDQFISVAQGGAGLKFTPAPDSTASGSFNVQASTSASNGGLGGGVATATITVAPVNDAPLAAADSYATTDGTPLAIAGPGVLGNDSDVEGTPLTAVLINDVTNGVLALDADGGFTYTPNAGFTGLDSFEYAAFDGSSQSAPVLVNIAVTLDNQAPTAVLLGAAAMAEGTDTTAGYTVGSLTTVDPDAADTHTYSIVGGSDAPVFSLSGADLVLSAGVLDYETQSSFEVTVRSTDVFGLYAEQTFTVNVTDVNEAPTVSAIADQSVAEGSSLAPLSFTIGDAETAPGALVVSVSTGDALRVPLSGLVLGGGGASRTLTVTPNPEAYGGPVTITLSVSDGVNTTLSSFDITLTAVDDHVVVVNTASDVADGDTSSIDALLMDSGADGFISLREAIEAANNTANAGSPDRIEFDIAGAGPHSISLLSALPAVSDAVVIDAATQAGFTGAPIIELDGAGAGAGAHGLVLDGGGSTVRGLVVNRFDGSGIVLSGAGDHTIAGNYVGLDLTGSVDRGNGGYGIWVRSDANLIGGTGGGDRNVVSGNGIDGIVLDGVSDNVVVGNYIGTDATGTVAVGNSEDGIWLAGATDNRIGGSTSAERNLLSGNLWSGIGSNGLSADNLIQGNYIGVGADGTTPLGNQRAGIRIEDGAGTIIGGSGGAANVIAHNTLDGVAAVSGTGHAILQNAIYANGGLGIDLLDDGVTANDAGDGDAGTNLRMNFPVLYTVVVSGGNVTIEGEAGPGATVHFYGAEADATNHGEGRTYLGSVTIGGATPGSVDATARRFSVTFAAGSFGVGDALTATATDSGGNTSEFAHNVTATAVAPQIAVTPTAGLITTEDGGTASFSVVLLTQPTSSVTIDLVSSDATEGFAFVSSLTFTTADWNVAQTVIIGGLPDGSGDGDVAYTIVLNPAVSADLAYSGRDAADVAVVNRDGVNDAPSAVNLSNATVTEGVNTTGGFSIGTLSTLDADTFDSHTYSIVGGADAARFSISGDTLLLDAGVLDFETKSQYFVRVRSTDIGGLVRDQTFTISVANVNDPPVLVTNAGAAVGWGGTTVLSNAMLRTTDVDNWAAQLVYTVTGLAGGGSLRVGGVPLGVNGTFTQVDVNNGRVTYVHDAATAGPDSFTFTVSDGAAGVGPATFALNVADPPIIVPDPVVTPPPPVTPPDPGPDPEPAPEPAPEPTGSDPDSGGSGPSEPPLGDGAVVPGAEELADPFTQLPGTGRDASDRGRGLIRVAVADGLAPRLQALGNSFGALGSFTDGAAVGDAFETRTQLADLSIFGLDPRLTPTAQAVSLSTFQATLEDIDWVTELDRMRNDIDAQVPTESALVVSSVAVTSSLSVGYVLWLLRGGLLLSSLLSSLPAWTVIDPMPVLSRTDHDDEDDGDDPLEKLFGRARAALGMKRGKRARRAAETVEEVMQ